jgi:hypothetical protein
MLIGSAAVISYTYLLNNQQAIPETTEVTDTSEIIADTTIEYNSIANREDFGNLLDESKDHIMGDSRLLQ